MKIENCDQKEQVESVVSVHSRQRFRSETVKQEIIHDQRRYYDYQVQNKQRQSKRSSLTEAIQSHPNVKKLTHDRVEYLRKLMEESHKGRNLKQMRILSRNFIDKCGKELLDPIIDKTYQEFYYFLRYQKHLDDQKCKKMSHMIDQYEQSKKKHKDWKTPLQKFLEQEKNRSSKKVWG